MPAAGREERTRARGERGRIWGKKMEEKKAIGPSSRHKTNSQKNRAAIRLINERRAFITTANSDNRAQCQEKRGIRRGEWVG